MGIGGSTVTVSDGTTSWSSARTFGGAAQGRYTISGLRPGRYDAIVSADKYVSATRTITIAADTTTDFPLLPVPETMSHTFEYQINDGDGTCSDGTQSRPCRITAIPIHNAGPLDATLSWKAAAPIKLAVTLFQNGQPTPLARSTAVDATSQRMAMNLPGGAVYELPASRMCPGSAPRRMRCASCIELGVRPNSAPRTGEVAWVRWVRWVGPADAGRALSKNRRGLCVPPASVLLQRTWATDGSSAAFGAWSTSARNRDAGERPKAEKAVRIDENESAPLQPE